MSAAASAPSCFPIANTRSPPSPPRSCASRCAGSPDRSEHFLGDSHGRDNISTAKLALDDKGQLPRPRARHRRRHGRVSVLLRALYSVARHGHGDRPLRHSRRACAPARRLHQHGAGRCLSRRRPARGVLSDRARGRSRRARDRHGARRHPPQEPDQAEGAAVHDADRQGLRFRRFRRHARARAGAGRLGRLSASARAQVEARRQIARHRHRAPMSRPAATTGRRPRTSPSTATAASPC